MQCVFIHTQKTHQFGNQFHDVSYIYIYIYVIYCKSIAGNKSKWNHVPWKFQSGTCSSVFWPWSADASMGNLVRWGPILTVDEEQAHKRMMRMRMMMLVVSLRLWFWWCFCELFVTFPIIVITCEWSWLICTLSPAWKIRCNPSRLHGTYRDIPNTAVKPMSLMTYQKWWKLRSINM